MGVEASDVEPLVAVVRCQGKISTTKQKFQYEGIHDCAAAAALADGYKECKYSCMGMGNCERVCPTDAIEIVDGLAVINRDRCIACGKCAAECPRSIIGLLPVSALLQYDAEHIIRAQKYVMHVTQVVSHADYA